MIEKCTKVVVGWLISCDAIDEKNRELYSYAVYSVFLSVYPLIFAICFGSVIGEMERSIFIIVPFAIIRKFCGGYHTKNSWSCLLVSSLLLLLCIVLSSYIRYVCFFTIMTMLAVMSLIYFSPIDSENKKLGQEEYIRYKKMTVFWVAFFLLMTTLLYLCQGEKYSICISIGIILSAGLQIPCILKGKKISKED